MKKLLIAAMFIVYMNQANAGSAQIYQPVEEIAPRIVEVPVEKIVYREKECPPPQEPSEPSECDCKLSPWVGEFYFNECDIILHHTESESTEFNNEHLQHSMSYFQRFIFNKNKREEFVNGSEYHNDNGRHPFDVHRNTFGLYIGIESLTYTAEDETTLPPAGTAYDAHASFVDLHGGLSFQFRLFRKLLHILDLGGYYSIGTTPWNVDNTPTNIQYLATNTYGLYAALPTYFLLTRDFGLGIRPGIKYDLDNRVDKDDTAFIDFFVGLAIRWHVDFLGGDSDYSTSSNSVSESNDYLEPLPTLEDNVQPVSVPEYSQPVVEEFNSSYDGIEAGYDGIEAGVGDINSDIEMIEETIDTTF